MTVTLTKIRAIANETRKPAAKVARLVERAEVRAAYQESKILQALADEMRVATFELVERRTKAGSR